MASNPPLLSDYITQVQRLLHDSNQSYWTINELTDYINWARNRVVADTGCNRILQIVTLNAGQETYPWASLPSGVNTFDVLNLTVIWNSMRVPCNYMTFTEFNLKMRAWKSFQSRPVTFSVYGQNTVYVAPIPDQTYQSEWDTVVAPAVLVNQTDQDTIPFPFSEPVPFYAAYLAKYNEQSVQEADLLLKSYSQKIGAALRSSFTRRIANQYQM